MYQKTGVDAASLGVEDQPPVSNTGAVSTNEQNISDAIDWIGVTLHDDPEGLGLATVVGDREWIEQPRGILGYSRSKRSGNMVIAYGGREDMGAHLVLSGAGCRELEAGEYFPGWPGWLSYLLASGATVSRIDAARDERSGLLDLDELTRLWKAGAVSTRATKFEELGSHDARYGYDGHTLYIGSPRADKRLRIYDKAAEQANKAGKLAVEAVATGPGIKTRKAAAYLASRAAKLAELGHWVRCEIQLRGDRAQNAAELIAAGVSPGLKVDHTGLGWLGSALLGCVEFKAEPARLVDNPQRIARLPAWDALCSAKSKLSLASAYVARQVEQVKEWIDDSISACLATVCDALDKTQQDSIGYLRALLHKGRARMKARHVAMVQSYVGFMTPPAQVEDDSDVAAVEVERLAVEAQEMEWLEYVNGVGDDDT